MHIQEINSKRESFFFANWIINRAPGQSVDEMNRFSRFFRIANVHAVGDNVLESAVDFLFQISHRKRSLAPLPREKTIICAKITKLLEIAAKSHPEATFRGFIVAEKNADDQQDGNARNGNFDFESRDWTSEKMRTVRCFMEIGI